MSSKKKWKGASDKKVKGQGAKLHNFVFIKVDVYILQKIKRKLLSKLSTVNMSSSSFF